jgi:membrane-associated phospholipid phosphatase
MSGSRNRIRVAAVLAVVLFLAPAASLRGQESVPETGGDRLGRAALAKFGLDFREALAAPLHWRGGDLLAFGVTAGIGAALFAGDAGMARAIRKIELGRTADRMIAQLGNGYFLVGFDASLYLAGAIFDDAEFRTTALVGMESFLTTSAVVLAVKAVIGRARPSARETAASFHPFALLNRYASFPSGDAAGAFAVAAVIADRSDSPIAGVLAYTLAGLAALNRVHDDKHWVSDVFVGSALGFFIGRKIAALNRGRNRGSGPVRVAMGPARTGLGWTIDFAF